MKIRWARSATKHRVSRQRSRYVIEYAGIRFPVPAAEGAADERILYVGDDQGGVALEVMVVELEGGELFVIHAMPMRKQYQEQYEEAKKWRV